MWTQLLVPATGCSKRNLRTLRKLYFHFLSHGKGYDRGDSIPLDFESNGIPFGLKLKGELSPRLYPIQCERKWKYSFLSVVYCGLYRLLANHIPARK